MVLLISNKRFIFFCISWLHVICTKPSENQIKEYKDTEWETNTEWNKKNTEWKQKNSGSDKTNQGFNTKDTEWETSMQIVIISYTLFCISYFSVRPQVNLNIIPKLNKNKNFPTINFQNWGTIVISNKYYSREKKDWSNPRKVDFRVGRKMSKPEDMMDMSELTKMPNGAMMVPLGTIPNLMMKMGKGNKVKINKTFIMEFS